MNAKLSELRLAHEFQEKRQAEREEQRRIRERIREEEKAQREFDKARKDAEKEEARYEKALGESPCRGGRGHRCPTDETYGTNCGIRREIG